MAGPGAGRVVLLSADPMLVRVMAVSLRARNWEVVTAATGLLGDPVPAGAGAGPTVLVVDLGALRLLTCGNRSTALSRLCAWPGVPVVVLAESPRGREILGAVQAGAADFVVKPFPLRTLLDRLEAAAALESGPVPERVTTADFDLDLNSRTARRDDREIPLPGADWRLLALLVHRRGLLLVPARDDPAGTAGGPAAIRDGMRRLRIALEPDPALPRYLISEPGLGYRLRASHHHGTLRS
ncbi:MAG TPA: response regulator transcription factor [Kineosporiaceae bacterium]|nr:response regulator transcription factor [Kineosporiaceae bacterium]